MSYTIDKNTIKISDKSQFNPEHILECGQVFRYAKTNNEYIVYTKDLMAKIIEKDDRYHIITDNAKYFEQFFDLRTDYRRIKNALYDTEFMRTPMVFGGGIRILKQDVFETIVSFIISANNNIARIQNSLFRLCEMFGQHKNGYHAFPTLAELLIATVDDLKTAGLGYRAAQLYKTLRMLQYINLDQLKSYSAVDKKKFLKSLVGIGEKVADCIMLFAFGESTSFPVDTWINKVYNDTYKTTEPNRVTISNVLKERFGPMSGYAQQYLFYYYRSKTDK